MNDPDTMNETSQILDKFLGGAFLFAEDEPIHSRFQTQGQPPDSPINRGRTKLTITRSQLRDELLHLSIS
jgi:hypothetical protein